MLTSFLYTRWWIHSSQYSAVKVFNDTSFLPSLTLLMLMLLLNIPLQLACFLSLCAGVYAELQFPKAKF